VLDGAGSRAQAHLAGPAAGRLGLSLLAPDRPGFRGSSPVPDLSLLRCADDLVALLDRLDIDRVGVLAQSLGAPFGLALAYGHPDRVHRLGLVGPIGPMDRSGVLAGMDGPTRTVSTLARRAPWLLEPLFGLIGRQVRRDPARAADRLARARSAADQQVMRRSDVWPVLVDHLPTLWASPAAARREFATVAGPWGFELTGVAVPTTIWAAASDTAHPPGLARDLAARLPDATLVLEREGGVFGFLDRTEEILRTIAPDLPNHA
jgi:pimeloyl-ACP methyl ester carboxylesterase